MKITDFWLIRKQFISTIEKKLNPLTKNKIMKKFLLQCILAAIFLLAAGFTTRAQTYVGSKTCSSCHPEKYNDWVASGHPYKFSVITNAQAPVYPSFVVNFENQWMDSLGNGTHTWNDIAGVIGGFGWKARFVGTDGNLIGTKGSAFPDAGQGHNQFNFFGGEDYGWVNYHPSDVKVYNYSCFKCHTTGGDTAGTWLSGISGLGNFAESGIGCESCHGPGSDHIAAPSTSNIDRVYEFAHLDNKTGGLVLNGDTLLPDPQGNNINFLCGTCHNRGYKNQIDASSGFVKHHEQWDEFTHTDHYKKGFTCITCHDPHKRVIWDGDGITKKCSLCHSQQAATLNHKGNATCIDCHMPYSAKSGTKRGQSGYKADVRSHLFKITVDTASMFTKDGHWVRDDAEREASLSPAFSCLGCHNNSPDDSIPDKTLKEAVAQAEGMHSATAIINQNVLTELSLYPNPTSGETYISMNLKKAAAVSFRIYNVAGQLVYSEENIRKPAGETLLYWNGMSSTGVSITPGCYFVKIKAGEKYAVKKFVLIK